MTNGMGGREGGARRGEGSTQQGWKIGRVGFPEAACLAGTSSRWLWRGSSPGLAPSKAQPPRLRRCCPRWDAEGTGSQLSRDLTAALLLQGKGRRESEGPKSCRRPSGRSPTCAEKRMSFESISSLPEVRGR